MSYSKYDLDSDQQPDDLNRAGKALKFQSPTANEWRAERKAGLEKERTAGRLSNAARKKLLRPAGRA